VFPAPGSCSQRAPSDLAEGPNGVTGKCRWSVRRPTVRLWIVNYLRLYTDDHGDARFEDLQFTFAPRAFAPPAPPVDVSDPIQASAFMMLRLPKGWRDGAHPAPARQFMIVVDGLVEVSAGGETRLLSPGDVLLAEDTAPPGHATTVIDDAFVAVTRL
jgi:quercetin dioxygenase-like cupin family protein